MAVGCGLGSLWIIMGIEIIKPLMGKDTLAHKTPCVQQKDIAALMMMHVCKAPKRSVMAVIFEWSHQEGKIGGN